MVMFDSLNRHSLPGYGGNETDFPNFARLSKLTTVFDQAYVCSMPCMPARRDFHTGRPNFLHSAWSPLQPYDESVPQMLGDAGVSTHLITDHYHYLEDGGATYHNRYTTWQCFRGQEGDPWIGKVDKPSIPPHINGKGKHQDWINREFLKSESDFPQIQTFDSGIDFIERNHHTDNWFLQLETFDPHEPFTAPKRFQQRFPQAGEEPVFDWPPYGPVTESKAEVQRAKDNYSALLSLCDEQLGRVLDAFDQWNLWEDTMLIVWTDHGYLLGEHNLWAKNHDIIWNEIGHTPFFISDPRHLETNGQRRGSLVQPAIDLGPTLLNFFGQKPTANMTGKDLQCVVKDDHSVREAAIYGYFNRPLHITNGQQTQVRYLQNVQHPFHFYTMMPTHMRGFFRPDEQLGAELMPSLPFSNGRPVLRYPGNSFEISNKTGPILHFDNTEDPHWQNPIRNGPFHEKLTQQAKNLCQQAHAPSEMLIRYGFA